MYRDLFQKPAVQKLLQELAFPYSIRNAFKNEKASAKYEQIDSNLTPKEILFIRKFLETGSATEAAIACGRLDSSRHENSESTQSISMMRAAYDSLQRFLERAQEALVQDDRTMLRDYAASARALLNSLDEDLDYSCGHLACDMHAVYEYMIRLIDKAVEGQDPFWRMSACQELAFSLARAWGAVDPHA